MKSYDTDTWATPQAIFDPLDGIFHFTCDVCATMNNHKCVNYISPTNNALNHSTEWGLVSWMNPPYSRGNIDKFMERAYLEHLDGKTIVCLVPPSLNGKWFNNYGVNGRIYTRLGRIKFINPLTGDYGKNPRGDNILIVFGEEKTEELKKIGWIKINGD